MRDARLVGPSGDGQWLIIEGDGEHLRLPMDDALRAAVRREMQMPMPLQTGVSPREVQGRIRAGETAAQIAESCGVAVELIARFEGPVLDERRWQAERARRTVVGGTSLQERFAAAVDEAAGDAPGTTWDAWIDREDASWRVSASCADGRSAVWSWDTQTTKLRGQNDLGRFALSGRVVSDDLEAVLRPLASRPAPTPAPPREPQRRGANADPDAPRVGAKRRTSVPSWDEILLGSNPRPPAGESPD